MDASAKETRRRLSKCLAELTRIKPDDLVRRDPFFKVGVQDFRRSLDLFRKLARSNLRRVPSDYLVHVADHAEKALGQFRNVLAFNGGGQPNSGEACGFMLNEIRNSYSEMYEDLTTIISNPHGRGERVSHPTNPTILVAGVFVLGLVAAAAIVYYFGVNTDLGHELANLFHV
jgi:hypothetical protein